MKIVAILFFLLVSMKIYGQDLRFFVSPSGNDSNNGTSVDTPYKTLNAAREAIRGIKKNGLQPTTVMVYLRDGSYELSETFVLNHEDSGIGTFSVTYSAYNDEVPVISASGVIIRLEGDQEAEEYIQNINFKGLTFTHSGVARGTNRETAILFRGVKNCSFTDNCIRNTYACALEISGEGNRVLRNSIYDIGSCGISCESTGSEPNYIAFNNIHNCSLMFNNYPGILVNGGKQYILNNLIHNMPYAGIIANYKTRDEHQKLIIEYNEITRIGNQHNDCAGIHLIISGIASIRTNYISDISSSFDKLASAIIIESGTSDIIIENNIIYRNNECLIIKGSNSNIHVINNYFIESRNDIIRCDNSDYRQVNFSHNIFYFTSTDTNIFSFNGNISLPDSSENNIFWNPRGCIDMRPVVKGIKGAEYFEEWQKLGYDTSSIVNDPGFKDPGEDDYSFKSDSLTNKAGIRPIDTSEIGLFFHDRIR